VRTEKIEELLLALPWRQNPLAQTKPWLGNCLARTKPWLGKVHDSLNMKHNQAQHTNEWLYEYLHDN
jgi:hypothetical protein